MRKAAAGRAVDRNGIHMSHRYAEKIDCDDPDHSPSDHQNNLSALETSSWTTSRPDQGARCDRWMNTEPENCPKRTSRRTIKAKTKKKKEQRQEKQTKAKSRNGYAIGTCIYGLPVAEEMCHEVSYEGKGLAA
jgi:hypothetical protein